MLTYDLRLMKRNKTFPEKFCLALKFEKEADFIEQYKAVRKLNLEANYSKKKFMFYMPPTVDNVVGLIRLRTGAELDMTDDAKEVFDSLREKALAEIQVRTQEIAYIDKLKTYGKLKPVTVKSCNSKNVLYNHQKFLYLLATHVRKTAYWSDPGTGKTAPALLSVAKRVELGQVRKCIVVVPCNLLYKWAEGSGNEIEKHTYLHGMVLDGDKETRISKIKRFLKDPSMTFLVTSYNFWSGRRMAGNINRNDDEYNLLMNSGKVQMFICDESHRVKNPTALVTKNVLKHFPKVCKYGILLSGTPQPRSMLDIFTQSKLVDHTVFGHDYYSFQSKYFKSLDFYKSKWAIKSKRHKEVLMAKAEARALVYSTDDCLDLPKEINETVYIYQNDDYLRELRSMSAAQIKEAMDSGDKGKGVLSKLLIATCGFTYQKDALGNNVAREFKTNPKIDALETLVTNIVEAGKKTIIWSMWRHDPTIIKRLLDKLGYPYIHIARADSKKDRYDKAKLFDNSPDIPILVASPRHISEGLDIYSPAYSIYYSYDFDFLPLVQSKARNRRMGSSDYHSAITYYYLCVKDSVEEDVLLALKEKKSIKDAMFGACKNLINRISQFRSKKCRR